MLSSTSGALRDRLASADWLDRGVLVYGPRKSGTTLFQTLLDGSDELFAYPDELKLKRRSGRSITSDAYLRRCRVASVVSDRLSIEGYKSLWREAGLDGARWPLGDLVRFDALCVVKSIDRPPGHPTLWCAKEVGGGRRDILALWRRMFAPGKALFLVRDPLFTTRAVLNDRRRKGVRLPVSDVVHQVTDPLRTMRRQMRYLDDPDVHFTVYEDLVADPEREMRKVTEFLGIGWSPTFTRPSLFGEPVVVRTASQQTTEVFRPTTKSWRDGLTEREQKIVAVAARIARSLPHLAVDYDALRERIARRHAERGAAARPAAIVKDT